MTIPVTTRSGKGAPLTSTEMDTNLTNLARVTSDTQEGNIEIATQAEVDTGTNTLLAVVPSTLASILRDQLTGTFATPGGINLTGTGTTAFELRWGSGTMPSEVGGGQSNDAAITFTPSFTTAPFMIIGGASIGKNGTGQQLINSLVVNQDASVTATTSAASIILSSNSSNVNHTGVTYYWLAISVTS